MSSRKGKVSVRCCVVNCANTSLNSPELRFYRFPTATVYAYKQKRRNNWISAVKRKNLDGSTWQPSNSARICSQHFVGNLKSEDPLSPSYNPSIFPAVYDTYTVSEKSNTQRYPRPKKTRIEETWERSTSDNIRKETQTVSDEDMVDKYIALMESENRDDAIVVNLPRKIDQQTQVYFMDEIRSDVDWNCKNFICNRYVYIDSHTKNHCSTCDVELQVFIPELTTSERNAVEKLKSIHRRCETYIIRDDKSLPPEDYKCDSNSTFKCTPVVHAITSIKEDRQMLDLAGVSLDAFQLLMKILTATGDKTISKEKCLLIFLLKMKCGLTYSALGVLFGIPRSTAKRIFISVLQCLAMDTKKFIFWPSRKIVQATMPHAFKETYSNCRVIIDYIEFKVEQPSKLDYRVKFYSHRKKVYTLKILVGCTPSGVISFVSKCFEGRTTDAQITSCAELLDLLEPGDVIITDKGVPQIKTKIVKSKQRVLHIMPPFLHDYISSPEEVNEICRVASMHIKRIMQRLRVFRILDKFTVKMLPLCDDIVFVCCVLVNLQSAIIKQSNIN